MKALFALACAAVLAISSPLRAGDNTVVVELFTSQGCSSCPPADKLLHKLIAKDNLIVLSLHVDYWDYIGWKDQFANPAFTKRQKAYAHVAGRNMVYTPQMIIDGREHVVGARTMELADLIAEHALEKRRVKVDAARDGDVVRVGVMPLVEGLEGPFLLQLVRYTPERTVKITRGENAGRTLTYVHVVDGWETIGEWDGRGPKSVNAKVSDQRPVVVLVQAQGPGEIIAAAELD